MKLLTLCISGVFEIATLTAWAGTPTFDELYKGVAECRYDLSHYTDIPMSPNAEAVLISLPVGGAIHGVLINTFYFAPAKGEQAETYGLVFDAPLDVIVKAFPELAARETINGYLRRISRLSDETGERGAERRTVLTCSGGTHT